MTIEQQIQVIQATSAKACQSPEAARKFLEDACITELMQEDNIQQLQQQLLIWYNAKQMHPKSKICKKAYQDVLNELDREMQLLPLPF